MKQKKIFAKTRDVKHDLMWQWRNIAKGRQFLQMVSKLEEKDQFIKKAEKFKVLCVCLKNTLTGQNSDHFLIFLFFYLFQGLLYPLGFIPLVLVPLILCKWLTSPTHCWQCSRHEQSSPNNASGKWRVHRFLRTVFFSWAIKRCHQTRFGPAPYFSLLCSAHSSGECHSSREMVDLCCGLSSSGCVQ